MLEHLSCKMQDAQLQLMKSICPFQKYPSKQSYVEDTVDHWNIFLTLHHYIVQGDGQNICYVRCETRKQTAIFHSPYRFSLCHCLKIVFQDYSGGFWASSFLGMSCDSQHSQLRSLGKQYLLKQLRLVGWLLSFFTWRTDLPLVITSISMKRS